MLKYETYRYILIKIFENATSNAKLSIIVCVFCLGASTLQTKPFLFEKVVDYIKILLKILFFKIILLKL